MERTPLRPIRPLAPSTPTLERLQDPIMQAAVEIATSRGDEARSLLRQRLQEQFGAEEFETIEALFDAWEVLTKQQAFDAQRTTMKREQLGRWLRMFTEDQFLLTHFLLVRGSDRALMTSFWRGLEYIAERNGYLPELAAMRSGVMSQVAVYRILEHLGEYPQLSHPREDAYNAIDVWASGDVAVQVKGWNQDEPELIESDDMVLPAVTVPSDGSGPERVYTPHERLLEKSHVFYTKVKDYAQQTGRPLTGYVMVVPFGKIDTITGEPSEEVISYFREKLKGAHTT